MTLTHCSSTSEALLRRGAPASIKLPTTPPARTLLPRNCPPGLRQHPPSQQPPARVGRPRKPCGLCFWRVPIAARESAWDSLLSSSLPQLPAGPTACKSAPRRRPGPSSSITPSFSLPPRRLPRLAVLSFIYQRSPGNGAKVIHLSRHILHRHTPSSATSLTTTRTQGRLRHSLHRGTAGTVHDKSQFLLKTQVHHWTWPC